MNKNYFNNLIKKINKIIKKNEYKIDPINYIDLDRLLYELEFLIGQTIDNSKIDKIINENNNLKFLIDEYKLKGLEEMQIKFDKDYEKLNAVLQDNYREIMFLNEQLIKKDEEIIRIKNSINNFEHLRRQTMKNKVILLGYYGSDQTHAQSAWTSTNRELTQDKIDRIPALLKMLSDEGHETPFEKSSLHFLATSDIATHIHLLKHRIGVSINGESARYKELKEDKYYIPVDWDSQEQQELQKHVQESLNKYHDTLTRLTPILGRKRAKESARFYLPYATQITYDVMFNFRSFVHFQRLRNSGHAQVEVQEVAQQMLDIVKDIKDFKYTVKAFKL